MSSRVSYYQKKLYHTISILKIAEAIISFNQGVLEDERREGDIGQPARYPQGDWRSVIRLRAAPPPEAGGTCSNTSVLA